MSRTLLKLLAVSGLLIAGNAIADSTDNTPDSRIYFSPTVTSNTLSTDWNAGNGMGFGLGLGKAISQSWNLELNSQYAESQYKNAKGSLRTTDTYLEPMYFFNRNPAFSPFVEAGVGDMNIGTGGGTFNRTEANIGAGFMHWMHGIALRADVRYRDTFLGNNSSGNDVQPRDVIISLGLAIPLGAAPAPAPAPAPVVAPAPEPVAEVAPAPAPAPVPEEARPVAHTKLVLEGTRFAFGKASLLPSGKAKLDEDAKMLNDYPDINAKISGYTDSIGTAKYNLKLSKERAATVAAYLESKGVAANRLTEEGYGKADPIDSNKTKAGRAANRRVEIETLN